MGPFEMVLGIVAVVTFASLINKWIAAKHGYEIEDEDGGKMVKARPVEDSKTLKRIEQLEKRVRVLERIATDDSARLASEIEALQASREDDLSDALAAPRFTGRETTR